MLVSTLYNISYILRTAYIQIFHWPATAQRAGKTKVYENVRLAFPLAAAAGAAAAVGRHRY